MPASVPTHFRRNSKYAVRVDTHSIIEPFTMTEFNGEYIVPWHNTNFSRNCLYFRCWKTSIIVNVSQVEMP